jgi:hypothetical protein
MSDEKNRWADGSAAWDSIYRGYPSLKLINEWLSKLKTGYYLKEYHYNETPVELLEEALKEQTALKFLKDLCKELFKVIHESSDILEEQLYKIIISLNDFSTDKKNRAFDEINSELHFRILDVLEEYNNKFVDSNASDRIYDLTLDKFISISFPDYKRIYVIDQKTDTQLQPHDIGIGLSQIIPIIIGVLEKSYSIFSVEQPELHIHPAIQVELADLFIDQVNRDTDSLYLIENHSEHIILRMLRRIESSTKKIQLESLINFRNDKKKIKEYFKSNDNSYTYLDPTMVNVFWCHQSKDGQKIDQLPIDETGEFTRKWPGGFFEERSRELFPDD